MAVCACFTLLTSYCLIIKRNYIHLSLLLLREEPLSLLMVAANLKLSSTKLKTLQYIMVNNSKNKNEIGWLVD